MLSPRELELLREVEDDEPQSILPPDFVQTPYVPKENKK